MSIESGFSFAQLRTKALAGVRHPLLVVSLAVVGLALPVYAEALPQHPCTPQLEKLMADWNAAGFDMPSKPGQAIVHGRKGRISSGAEVILMSSQIRQAILDCQHGDVESVRERVALVSDRLNQVVM
jgi:hypothetical protein